VHLDEQVEVEVVACGSGAVFLLVLPTGLQVDALRRSEAIETGTKRE